MRWSDLAARERRTVLVGGALMGGAILVRFLVLPYTAAVTDARDAVEREWGLLRSERALLREASGYPRAFSAVGARFLEGVPKLLPGGTPAGAQAELARRIDRAVAAGTAVLTRVEPLAPRVLPTGYVALPLRVEGEGDLEGLLSLLASLEGGPTLFHLEDLSVDAVVGRGAPGVAGPGSGAETLSFRFTVTGFALDERSLRGAGADTAGAADRSTGAGERGAPSPLEEPEEDDAQR